MKESKLKAKNCNRGQVFLSADGDDVNETQIQIPADWSMSHAKRATKDNWKIQSCGCRDKGAGVAKW